MVRPSNSMIRHIRPPKLGPMHLGKAIDCYRPVRIGQPKMALERLGQKTIAHNYGHGGSGWTLAPASANYVNDLLIASDAVILDKDTAITILGAGVLGLFSAYDLLKKGYHNLTVIAEKFDDLASHYAGGLFAPSWMTNDSAGEALIDVLGRQSYEFYALIAKGEHSDFTGGARIVPMYCDSRENAGVEAYVGTVMQPAKDVQVDFGNGTVRSMVVYDDAMFMDTGKLMGILGDYLDRHGVRRIVQMIHDFSEITDHYVINCTGMGAWQLNQDKDMLSAQGHLILLKDQDPSELNYMMSYSTDLPGMVPSEENCKRFVHLFPKHFPGTAKNDIGVIGGSYIEGATDATPNQVEFERVVARAKAFYGID